MARQAGQGPGLLSCRPHPKSGSGRLPERLCDLLRGEAGPTSPLTETVLGGAAVVSRRVFPAHLHVCVFFGFVFQCFWHDGFSGKVIFRSQCHLSMFALILGRWASPPGRDRL